MNERRLKPRHNPMRPPICGILYCVLICLMQKLTKRSLPCLWYEAYCRHPSLPTKKCNCLRAISFYLDHRSGKLTSWIRMQLAAWSRKGRWQYLFRRHHRYPQHYCGQWTPQHFVAGRILEVCANFINIFYQMVINVDILPVPDLCSSFDYLLQCRSHSLAYSPC